MPKFEEFIKGFEEKPNITDQIWSLWDKSLDYMSQDMTEENIEKYNKANEEFSETVAKNLKPRKVNEFYELIDTFNDPKEVEDFLKKNFGEKQWRTVPLK
jgi:hypothetical protein